MESPPTDQDSSEVNVILLMQKRLPRYVVNCLQAAGYDELEVVASMDTTEGETSSICRIEKLIERRHKNNPNMLPSYSSDSFNSESLPFEFPPGHRIRICNFVQEVKQLYRNKISSSKIVSTKHARSATTAKRIKPMTQPEDQFPLSVDELTCKVHESIRKWIGQQKLMALNSLKQGKHYSVIVNNHGNGQITVVVNCGICRTSVRLHLLNTHYQISNWTRHVKRCASNTSCTTDSKQTTLHQLFPKTLTSTVKTQSSPTKQSVSKSRHEPSISSTDPANDNLNRESSSPQVFSQAPPSMEKEGQI